MMNDEDDEKRKFHGQSCWAVSFAATTKMRDLLRAKNAEAITREQHVTSKRSMLA
jgi:hypothetical protein